MRQTRDSHASAPSAAEAVLRRFLHFAREAYADVRQARDAAPAAARVAKTATAAAAATLLLALTLFVGGLIGPGPSTLLAMLMVAAAAAGELTAIFFVRAALTRAAFAEQDPRARAPRPYHTPEAAPGSGRRPTKTIRRRAALSVEAGGDARALSRPE